MIFATELTPELLVEGHRRAQQPGVHLEWLAVDAEDPKHTFLPSHDAPRPVRLP